MSKESKTGKKAAQAAAAMAQKDKKVITDEKYIEELRYSLANGLYVAQEGARALLREYDKLLVFYKGLEENLLDRHNQLIKVEAERVAQVAGLNAEIAKLEQDLLDVSSANDALTQHRDEAIAQSKRAFDHFVEGERKLSIANARIEQLEAEKAQNAKIAEDAPFADQVRTTE